MKKNNLTFKYTDPINEIQRQNLLKTFNIKSIEIEKSGTIKENKQCFERIYSALATYALMGVMNLSVKDIAQRQYDQ